MGISLKPDVLIKINGFSFTNTLILTAILVVFWVVLGFIFSRKKTLVPDKIQNFLEFVLEVFFNFVKGVTGSEELTREFFPFFISFFLLIFSCNIVEILPGVESGILFYSGKESIPFFRAPSSDWNFTLALALLGMLAIHIWAIKKIGLKKYIQKFIHFHPIYFFSGLLEFISQLAQVLSLSLRLYINILVGGILLVMAYHFFPFLMPLPLLFFEIFVSFIQALVFSVLLLIFWVVLVKKESH